MTGSPTAVPRIPLAQPHSACLMCLLCRPKAISDHHTLDDLRSTAMVTKSPALQISSMHALVPHPCCRRLLL